MPGCDGVSELDRTSQRAALPAHPRAVRLDADLPPGPPPGPVGGSADDRGQTVSLEFQRTAQ
jgi:hypothetical protein